MAANTTPSKTPYWVANNTGQVNKYGAPPNTSNRLPIAQANSISTQDYTGRGSVTLGENATKTVDANAVNDQASPLTLTTNAIAVIIPPNAVVMRVNSTAAFNVSETGTAGAALTQYYTQPLGSVLSIDVARIQVLYFSGTAPLSFYFSIV